MFKRLSKAMSNLIVWSILALIVVTVVAVLARAAAGLYAAPRTFAQNDLSDRPVAIVFGAGLLRDGSPTAVLRDRVQEAANLYFGGKVRKLLMSGDNSYVNYNEPEAMRQYALELGVPEKDIVLDYAGRRTYDTCYRAKVIFGVDQAILVTQAFHLPRAIFLCNMLGVDGVGVSADLRTYPRGALLWWNLREFPATLSACLDVVARPLPILGKPEPIFPPSAE
jgi:SanA protein